MTVTVPRPLINIDEGNRRWTAGARGESISLTPFSSRQYKTLETPQSGGGNVTSIQPKTTSLTEDPLTEPNSESPSSNTNTVSKPKDGPFFPGRKSLKLKYSRVGGIVLNTRDPDLSNTTLGKQKRVTFTDPEGDQWVEMQFNMAEKITFGKKTPENFILEDGIGDPILIEVEEITTKVAEDPDNLPGNGGWPRTATGQP
ncbi:hypothetical protein FF1_005536 [Malus domestica]